jgi:hypothetical protein
MEIHGFQSQEGVAATIDPFIDTSLLTLKQCYGSVSARLHGPGWKVSILCVMAYIWLAVILSIESNRMVQVPHRKTRIRRYSYYAGILQGHQTY